MIKWITKERKWVFATGALAGVAVLTFLKTKAARNLAVKGVAGSIMLKDKVLETAANIKEEADDICAEAVFSAKSNCDCGDSCECGDECSC